MVQAITARTQGDDYQARVFWLNACRLFMPNSHVSRVVYENNTTKYFDDVSVFYDCNIPIEHGDCCLSDHYQVKFHVDHSGKFSYESFTDPAFLGVKKKSLLQRLHDFLANVPHPCRVYVLAPWGIKENDPLEKLVSNTGGELRLSVLSSERAEMRKVRECWVDHLAVSDDQSLLKTVRPLRLVLNHSTLDGLRMQLNFALAAAGLKPVDDSHRTNPYDDVIRKMHQCGVSSFTREELLEMCKQEGLWLGQKQQGPERRIGIRSFMRWAEHMEEETEKLLRLEGFFEGRDILNSDSWNGVVATKIMNFAGELLSDTVYDLRIDAHSSIAFAAGHSLSPKMGIQVGIRQKILGQSVMWRTSTQLQYRNPVEIWEIAEILINPKGTEVALCLSVTHNALEDVELFVRSNEHIHRIVSVSIVPAPGPSSIKGGDHALQLAQAVTALLKQRSAHERREILHIFAAAPNGFMFVLGQLSHSFGRIQLYEYDFDSNAPGAYTPSIRLPFAKE